MLAAAMPVMPAAAMASISIGEYLEMGTYYGEPILWRCVDIDENGPLILSDKIICLKSFDAVGDNISGSHGRGYDSGNFRKECGSDYWADSNMRSWLNSNASAGNVTWLCGNPPDNDHIYDGYNDYADEAGFKTNFTPGELGAVKRITQDSLLDYYEYSDMSPYGSTYHSYSTTIGSVVQNAKTTAYREQVTDDFFLLDVNQIYAVYNNRSVLGDDYYIGRLSEGAVRNSEYSLGDSYIGNKWSYWLRSPGAGGNDGTHVRRVTSDGGVHGDSAYYCLDGVRPAFYLNLPSSSFSFGNGTLAAPYKVKGTGGGADYEVGIMGHNAVDGHYVINSVAGNNTGEDASCMLYTAVYSPDGKVKGCGWLEAQISAGDDTGVDIAVDCDIEPGDVIKTFMWDENNKPLAKAAEYTAR